MSKDTPTADEELARGALDAIHRLLDDGGIPRGTFADDHVRNLVVFFNWQDDALRKIAAGDAAPARIAADILAKIAGLRKRGTGKQRAA